MAQVQNSLRSVNRRCYRWFYDRIFSRFYDPAIGLFLEHFGGEDRFRTEMLRSIVFKETERVLDLCCGTGGLTLVIRRRAGPQNEIIGLDQSIGQLKRALRKNIYRNVYFIKGNAAVSPFPAQCFDKVCIEHSLHEMQRELRLAVLREARRVMGQDGQLVVIDFHRPSGIRKQIWLSFWLAAWIPSPLNFESRNLNNLLKSDLADEVREAGFRNIRKELKFSGTIQVITARPIS